MKHAFLDVPLRNDWQRLLIASRGCATYPQQRIHGGAFNVVIDYYTRIIEIARISTSLEKFGRKKKKENRKDTDHGRIEARSRRTGIDRVLDMQMRAASRPRSRYLI